MSDVDVILENLYVRKRNLRVLLENLEAKRRKIKEDLRFNKEFYAEISGNLNEVIEGIDSLTKNNPEKEVLDE